VLDVQLACLHEILFRTSTRRSLTDGGPSSSMWVRARGMDLVGLVVIRLQWEVVLSKLEAGRHHAFLDSPSKAPSSASSRPARDQQNILRPPSWTSKRAVTSAIGGRWSCRRASVTSTTTRTTHR
jgi:hypothetical protein